MWVVAKRKVDPLFNRKGFEHGHCTLRSNVTCFKNNNNIILVWYI